MTPEQAKKYATPSEIINRWPELADKWNWNAQRIGVLILTNVLPGRKISKTETIVEIEAVKKLVAFINQTKETLCIKM